MSLLPPRPALFPYTTLFRSHSHSRIIRSARVLRRATIVGGPVAMSRPLPRPRVMTRADSSPPAHRRSEEHTSELQSLRHLVCRLLLEKKKQKKTQNIQSSCH